MLAFGEILMLLAVILIIYGVLNLIARRSMAKGIKKYSDDVENDDKFIDNLFKKKKL